MEDGWIRGPRQLLAEKRGLENDVRSCEEKDFFLGAGVSFPPDHGDHGNVGREKKPEDFFNK